MSEYTAIFVCDKCGRQLTQVSAHTEINRPDILAPQDMAFWTFAVDSKFCQECLNGR